jgi:hypothetical protein
MNAKDLATMPSCACFAFPAAPASVENARAMCVRQLDERKAANMVLVQTSRSQGCLLLTWLRLVWVRGGKLAAEEQSLIKMEMK